MAPFGSPETGDWWQVKRGYLSDFFQGVGAKRLALVDTITDFSNQHEVTGSDPLRRILGETARKRENRFDATYVWIGGEQDSLTEYGKLSWYDSRANDETRSAEWRLYYQTNPVTRIMQPGNTLFVARRSDDHLFFVVAPEESTVERQLLWLFGLRPQLTLEFEPHLITADHAAALDFTAQFILDELGIEMEDPDANRVDAIIDRFGTQFPSTAIFSDLARTTLPEVDCLDDPDGALMAWLGHEEAMFQRLEHRIVADRLRDGFADAAGVDVEGFLKFSLSVQNRRKSRMGHAFENHLAALFRHHDIPVTRQAVTERGNTVDFLIPGKREYDDPAWPAGSLLMLAAKSTCKDRWRQVLAEADRISPKHLATLEPAISPAQTLQMQAHYIQLVLPRAIHASYLPDQQGELMSVGQFLRLAKEKGRLRGPLKVDPGSSPG
jgi:hypothetical protein